MLPTSSTLRCDLTLMEAHNLSYLGGLTCRLAERTLSDSDSVAVRTIRIYDQRHITPQAETTFWLNETAPVLELACSMSRKEHRAKILYKNFFAKTAITKR